ncbi:MAG TPA: hypothetical protein VG929_02580 [Actinomycetota bacterium]|nr:hypothetical protein [Actinomycetota bacterium]
MKRKLSIATMLGVAVCVVAAASLATAAPAPKKVLEDPLGDANFLNDQGTGDGSFGDHVTPADVSSVTDLVSVSLANDAKNLYITWETEAAAPATQGVGYRLRVNPDGPGGTHCLVFEAFYPGATDALTEAEGHLRDTCAGGAPIKAEVLGNMLVVSRKAHKGLGKGATLKAPQAHGFIYSGGSYPAGFAYPVADTTKVGKDYKLVK